MSDVPKDYFESLQIAHHRNKKDNFSEVNIFSRMNYAPEEIHRRHLQIHQKNQTRRLRFFNHAIITIYYKEIVFFSCIRL